MDKITASLLNTFSEQFDLQKLSDSVKFEHFVNYCVTTKNYRGSFELEDVHSDSGGIRRLMY